MLERKLSFLVGLGEQAKQLAGLMSATTNTNVTSATDNSTPITYGLAQERLLHLAMEAVTDSGHMLIDAFMMRDAGSYEDIINILFEEKVFAAEVHAVLLELVRMKSELVKEYETRLTGLHPILLRLADVFSAYDQTVRKFTANEMRNIGQ